MVITIIILRDLTQLINPHKMFVFQIVVLEPVFLEMVIPVVYLTLKKSFRRFMWEQIKSVFFYILPESYFNISPYIAIRNLCFPLPELSLQEDSLSEISLKEFVFGKKVERKNSSQTDGKRIPNEQVTIV